MLQKSEELLEEAVLSQTLNSLREFENGVFNACTTFIETIEYVFHIMFFSNILITKHFNQKQFFIPSWLIWVMFKRKP